MEYIVLGQDKKEYGPVDQETLQKWVEHGRVFKDTKIRNTLIKKWNDAGTMDCLQKAFSTQKLHKKKEEGVTDHIFNVLGLSSSEHELTEKERKNTAFRLKYIPNPAGIFQRIAAFVIDLLIFAVFALILFFFMVISTGTWVSVDNEGIAEYLEQSESGSVDSERVDTEEISDAKTTAKTEPEVEKEDYYEEDEEVAKPTVFPSPTKLRNTFYSLYALFFASVLLYYGIGLGIYAQTIGMWFWGIIIVKGYDDEVLPMRAFVFTLFMFLIGPLTPLVVLLNPARRSFHDYLTGTRLINITARARS